MYREPPLTSAEIAALAQADTDEIEASLTRLAASGRLDVIDGEEPRYQARALVIPLGAPAGWESAVFDHFKALVGTVLCRLRENRPTALEDRVGGSTYTIAVWDGHPLAEEVYGALGQIRRLLGDLRTRVEQVNEANEVPSDHARVVIYAGQCVIQEEP
jgi:hypothetical protein